MIFHNKARISARFYASHAVSTVYHAGRIAWEAIKSCFGKGYWINDKPWNNADAWNNGV